MTQTILRRKENGSLSKLTTFYASLVMVVVANFHKVQCADQFFQIAKDSLPIKMEEPFLTSDVFECSREKSCTTLFHNSQSIGKDADSNIPALSVSKAKDLSATYPSCATALQVNDNEEGYYSMHHGNMRDSIEVECKVMNGTIYAIIHHECEESELVNGYEEPGSFRKTIKYVIDLEDVKLFVDSSVSCYQLTSFNCHHSTIHENGSVFSFFMDRNNIPMSYIGGGPVNGTGCQCSLTQNCVQPGTLCNCDKNDEVWRHDSGLVTEKQRLPLTEVRIGNTGGSGEMMRYIIGPVNCKSEV